jgi:hypothetical protein
MRYAIPSNNFIIFSEARGAGYYRNALWFSEKAIGYDNYPPSGGSVSASLSLQARKWAHVSIVCSGTALLYYIDGKYTGSLTRDVYDSAAYPLDSLRIGSVNPDAGIYKRFIGRIADPIIHNRALSSAEIAILADRTDPMLGGLIVEERPVLYFDMGAIQAVEGPAIITAESVIAMLGQKGALGPATVAATASIGMGGVKGASAPLNIVGTASVEAPGQKSTSGPATVSAQSSLGMGGIVELFGLDKTGPASFSAASSVGAGGVKASSSPAAIASASALGMAGVKTLLGLDKEGPATFSASSSLGMGGVKGAVSQAWIGADSEIVAAGVKAGIGSAAWLVAGCFMAGNGPDLPPILPEDIRGRIVAARRRTSIIATNRRVIIHA